jgi:predicted Zn-dependent protease
MFCLVAALVGVLAPWEPAQGFSLSDEKALGRTVLQKIREQFQLIEDGETAAYVQSVGDRVVDQLEGTPYRYQFFVIDEATPNAFAIPGGYVFLYRGLIGMMSSEGELASIISHEIAHVQAQHIRQRIEQSRILSVASLVGMLAGAFLGLGDDASRALATGAMAGARTLELQYSRENEEEADRLGFQYLCAAGYDPEAMVSIMRKISRLRWRSDSRVPSYLMSHPAVSERVNYLESLAAKERPSAAARARKDKGEFILMQAALVSDHETPRIALDHFRAQERQKEDPGAVAYGLGRLALRQGKLEEATERLREAASLRPSSPMVLSTMGAVYFQQGRLAEAKRVLTTALTLEPHLPIIHYRLASVLRESGQPEEALQHLRQAEQLAPLLPEVHEQLGILLGQSHDYGAAHYHLGRYHALEKDRRLALFHFEKALPFFPESSPRRLEIEDEIRELRRDKVREAQKTDAAQRLPRRPYPRVPVQQERGTPGLFPPAGALDP